MARAGSPRVDVDGVPAKLQIHLKRGLPGVKIQGDIRQPPASMEGWVGILGMIRKRMHYPHRGVRVIHGAKGEHRCADNNDTNRPILRGVQTTMTPTE
jgi:hypothetical protein